MLVTDVGVEEIDDNQPHVGNVTNSSLIAEFFHSDLTYTNYKIYLKWIWFGFTLMDYDDYTKVILNEQMILKRGLLLSSLRKL